MTLFGPKQFTAAAPWEASDSDPVKWEGGNLSALILINHLRSSDLAPEFKVQALNILQKLAEYEVWYNSGVGQYIGLGLGLGVGQNFATF